MYPSTAILALERERGRYSGEGKEENDEGTKMLK